MKIDICYNFFSSNNICTSSPSNKKNNIGVKYLILFFTEVSFNIFLQFALHLLNLDLYTINIFTIANKITDDFCFSNIAHAFTTLFLMLSQSFESKKLISNHQLKKNTAGFTLFLVFFQLLKSIFLERLMFIILYCYGIKFCFSNIS